MCMWVCVYVRTYIWYVYIHIYIEREREGGRERETEKEDGQTERDVQEAKVAQPHAGAPRMLHSRLGSVAAGCHKIWHVT